MSIASTAVATDELPADVRFPGVDALFAQLAALAALDDVDSIVVGDVSAADFRAVEEKRDSSGRGYHLFYLAEIRCLIITVPTFRHVQLHLVPYNEIRKQMTRMGVEAWVDTGDTAYPLPPPNNASGEGDSGGYPRVGYGPVRWPTRVMEAGYSQSMPSLRAKMRWWFAASNRQVKMVVLVKMSTPEAEIHIGE